ncbi:MAG: metal ABC transporter permease, partial [Leptospiraceae bacterium]|nr:metal ABC transporter permease [Leptospiraceae bacterium]
MTQFDATAYTGARQNHLHTLGRMTRYLWPADRTDLRVRVVAAMLALTVARLINVSVPYFYKRAVDALDTDANVIVIPLAMIFAYGGARLTQQLFGELRDFLFVRVAQHAQRTVALRTFRHLHALSLNFHLSRQTGALSRVIERGVRGIQFVLSFMLFNILPTLLEIGLVTGILFYMFNVFYAAIAGGTILLYVGFTLFVTEWRIKFRKQMNQTDSDANNKAVDSLLNFETVKYFSNEEHEFRRYDGALAGYERAAVRSQKSLTLLNIGQGLIISGGLIGLMVMAAFDVRDKHITIGDFVMINTYLIQLYLPLNFLGFVYREIKQSLVDMEKMFELLDVERDILDRNDAHELPAVHEPKTDFTNHAPAALDRIRPADASESGELIFEDVHFAYRSDRPILKGVTFRVQPGRTV